MIEIIGCILLIIIGVSFICMTVDELRTNYELRKSLEQGSESNVKIKDRVRLINGTIATIVGMENEPISLNKVYLIDKQYKGEYDDEYGYNREYYKKALGLFILVK